MNEILEILGDYFSDPALQVTFSGIVVTGMVVGAALAYGWQEAWRWAIAALPMIIFEEFSRRIVLASIGQVITMRPAVLASTVFFMYFAGVLVGAFIVERVRRPFVAERRKIEQDLREIMDFR
jgi:zinc transporter ZupT